MGGATHGQRAAPPGSRGPRREADGQRERSSLRTTARAGVSRSATASRLATTRRMIRQPSPVEPVPWPSSVLVDGSVGSAVAPAGGVPITPPTPPVGVGAGVTPGGGVGVTTGGGVGVTTGAGDDGRRRGRRRPGNVAIVVVEGLARHRPVQPREAPTGVREGRDDIAPNHSDPSEPDWACVISVPTDITALGGLMDDVWVGVRTGRVTDRHCIRRGSYGCRRRRQEGGGGEPDHSEPSQPPTEAGARLGIHSIRSPRCVRHTPRGDDGLGTAPPRTDPSSRIVPWSGVAV